MSDARNLPADAPARPRDWLDELYAEVVAPSRTAQPAAHIRGGARYDWKTPADALADQPQPPAEPEDAEDDEAENEAENEAEEVQPERHEPAPEAQPRREWFQPQPDYYPAPPPLLPAAQAAPAALSPRTRSLIYNATAAAAGWGAGLLGLFGDAIEECGTEAGIGAALILGIGSCLAIAHVLDRRTRHWWIGLAWIARIPLATAITALALYAPASHI